MPPLAHFPGRNQCAPITIRHYYNPSIYRAGQAPHPRAGFNCRIQFPLQEFLVDAIILKLKRLMQGDNNQSSRRHFLKTTLTLPVALAAAPAIVTQSALAADAPAPVVASGRLPKRQLGRSGPQATMLCLGGMEQALSPDYIDIAWSLGIRYFDSADCYLKGKSENIFGAWLAKYPERRKDIFLVSKDHPHQGPKQLLEMIDRRLDACGAKYLDGFYIHGLGTREYGDASLEWPKSDEFKKVAETAQKFRQGQAGRFFLP